jgi:hypothetical protein
MNRVAHATRYPKSGRPTARLARPEAHTFPLPPNAAPGSRDAQALLWLRVKKMWFTMLIFAAALGLTLAGCQATRAGYESAPYKVVRSDGKFALRDYPALMVVETPMAGANGSDGSFMRLFRFITGANDAKRKIAMTTPVFMSGNPTNATMAFVLPAKLRSGEVPQPLDDAVTVRELAAGRFAVLRYRGGRNTNAEAKSLARLQAWMQAEKLRVLSPPVYGYFDPPWTPTFLRRNEVMLRTEGTGLNQPSPGMNQP